LTNGTGSPDPAIFVSDLQDANKKFIFEDSFTSFFKNKKSLIIKKSQNSTNQGFPSFFALLIEGSASKWKGGSLSGSF
jgi:hypothetical protein